MADERAVALSAWERPTERSHDMTTDAPLRDQGVRQVRPPEDGAARDNHDRTRQSALHAVQDELRRDAERHVQVLLERANDEDSVAQLLGHMLLWLYGSLVNKAVTRRSSSPSSSRMPECERMTSTP